MNSSKRSRTIVRMLLTLALIGWCWGCFQSTSPRLAVGDAIPSFELQSLSGEKLSSDSLAGTPTVLNFWATWCGPCQYEIPTLKGIDRRATAKVVSIVLDNEPEKTVPAYVNRFEIDYPVLFDGHDLFAQFGGIAIPFTVVIDSNLTIVSIHRGLVSAKTLDRDLQGIS